MINYWIDMDGVLAQYDWNGYKGPNPPYLDPHAHYFRERIPDKKMLTVIECLNSKYPGHVYVLTRVSERGRLFLRQVSDKAEWLAEHCPFLNLEEQFIPIVSEKNNFVQAFYRPVRLGMSRGDILIDDYNKNLDAWDKAGGTAVKYCNGINTPNKNEPKSSWMGLHLNEDLSEAEILSILGVLRAYPGKLHIDDKEAASP